MKQPTRLMPFVVLFICLFIGCVGSVMAESPTESVIRSQTEQLPTEQIDQYWNELIQEYGGYFPDNQPPSFMELIVPGGKGLSFSQILNGLLRYFFHEIL